MIDNITIKNFKSIKSIKKIGLTNLNVLTGLNGSGKSSFIQSLLVLRQSTLQNCSKGLILHDDENIILGSGKDILYQYSGDETIKFQLQSNGQKHDWTFQYESASDVLKSIKFPKVDDKEGLFNKRFQYLNAEHIAPQEIYKKSVYEITENNNIGTKGEYVVHYLSEFGIAKETRIKNKLLLHPSASSDYLLHQVDAWMNEISPGIRLNARTIPGVNSTKLTYEYATAYGYSNEVKPFNTGFGISYALPIVVSLLRAKKGDLLIIENPESHLHPKGQSKIGNLLAYVAAFGVQIFVETHSDHIINGIRVALKNTQLDPSLIKFFYFSKEMTDRELYTIVDEIKIDKNGMLNQYPEGFLDEWNDQLMKLI